MRVGGVQWVGVGWEEDGRNADAVRSRLPFAHENELQAFVSPFLRHRSSI